METLLERAIKLNSNVFFKEYWEKKYHINNDTENERLNFIISFNEIANLLETNLLQFPFIRLVKDGKDIDLEKYVKNVKSSAFPNIINNNKVLDELNNGTTIIIQKAECLFENLNKFCNSIFYDFGISAKANIYITPKNSHGFNIHHDMHDVIVLQIHGEKKWDLYENKDTLLIENQPLSKQDRFEYQSNKTPTHLNLNKGNSIYIPRGFIHNTYTNSFSSIHIALGLYPIRIIDILRGFTQEAETILDFRKSIIGLSSQECYSNINALINKHLNFQFTDKQINTLHKMIKPDKNLSKSFIDIMQ